MQQFLFYIFKGQLLKKRILHKSVLTQMSIKA